MRAHPVIVALLLSISLKTAALDARAEEHELSPSPPAAQGQEERSKELETGGVGLNVTAAPFQARGDGQADDTRALLKAVAAAHQSGKSLFIPAGKYRISQPIVLRNGVVSLRGEGKSTILILAGDTNCITIDPGPSNFYGVYISDLLLDLGGQAGATGLYFKSGGQTCGAARVWITGLGENSIGVATANHNHVNNVKLQQIRVATDSGGSGTGFSIGADSTTMIDCEFNGGGAPASSGDGLIVPSTVSSLVVLGGEFCYARRGVVFPKIGPQSALLAGIRMEGITETGYWMEGFDLVANRLRGVTILNPYISGGTKVGIHAQGIESLNVIGGSYNDLAQAAIDLGYYVTGLITRGGMVHCQGPFLTGPGTNSPGMFILDDHAITGALRSRVTIFGHDPVADLFKAGTNSFNIDTGGGPLVVRKPLLLAGSLVAGSTSTPDRAAHPTYLRGPIMNDNPAVADGAVLVQDDLQVTGGLRLGSDPGLHRGPGPPGGEISSPGGPLALYGHGGVVAHSPLISVSASYLGAAAVPDPGAAYTYVRGPIRNDNPAVAGGAVRVEDDLDVSGSASLGGNLRVAGSVNGERGFRSGTVLGITTNLTVVLPGGRTNQLQFTGGILTGVISQ